MEENGHIVEVWMIQVAVFVTFTSMIWAYHECAMNDRYVVAREKDQ